MSEKENNDKPRCPICGGENTEVAEAAENSYGEFVNICVCKDCDIEFDKK